MLKYRWIYSYLWYMFNRKIHPCREEGICRTVKLHNSKLANVSLKFGTSRTTLPPDA